MNPHDTAIRDHVASRQKAYALALSEGDSAGIVMKDLAKFCRAKESTFHSDSRAHALAEGRREVYLRIMEHLELSVDDLYELYTGKKS